MFTASLAREGRMGLGRELVSCAGGGLIMGREEFGMPEGF